MAFFNLQAAFDSMPRKEIWEALASKDVLTDLSSDINSACPGSCPNQWRESERFSLEKYVRQDDSLSPVLFSEKHVIGKWNLRTVLIQTLLYPDDIVQIANSQEKLQQDLIEWQEELLGKGR